MKNRPRPLLDTPFWTPGMLVATGFMIAGIIVLAFRYTKGLGYTTNLSYSYPWGIWIAIDVASGVALAAGGFTTAFLAHILGKKFYKPITRPALLTAALGYTFVALGVFVDIGRSWAIWKPIIFQNHTSVLFEVGMCVMTYLTVLWIEFLPVIAERYGEKISILKSLNKGLDKFMWIFIVLGVVLSCMHQSSLGTLLLIAPTKLSSLWYTPILPLLFLTSAFAVGYPMVIVETTIATSSLKLSSEMDILSKLSRIVIILLGIYIALKLGDLIYRGKFWNMFDGTGQSNSLLIEIVFGAIVPWIMLLFDKVRNSRRLLFIASLLIVLGVLLNRINVFIVGFNPHFAKCTYYPSIGEILVTCSFVSAIFFLYRVFVTFCPVISAPKEGGRK
ncbi:NrfD/PsrC family molybdoenzyme membrane anchor subunit [Desulfothermus sp.]